MLFLYVYRRVTVLAQTRATYSRPAHPPLATVGTRTDSVLIKVICHIRYIVTNM